MKYGRFKNINLRKEFIEYPYNNQKLTLVKVLPYKKCGDVHEKFEFLENTRFKTLEHLLKAFCNTLAEFTST